MPNRIPCRNCGFPLAPVADPNGVAQFKDGLPDYEKTAWVGWSHGQPFGVFCPTLGPFQPSPGAAQPEDGVVYADYFGKSHGNMNAKLEFKPLAPGGPEGFVYTDPYGDQHINDIADKVTQEIQHLENLRAEHLKVIEALRFQWEESKAKVVDLTDALAETRRVLGKWVESGSVDWRELRSLLKDGRK